MSKPFVWYAIFGIVFFGFLVMTHEQVHVEIYKSYGIPSHIEYFKEFPRIVTITDRLIGSDECPESCKLANNINEAISYPLIIVTIIIYLGIFYILVILEKTNNYFERLFGETENESAKESITN